MKTLKQLCTPRSSIFDSAKRDTVLSLNNLVRHQLDFPHRLNDET